MSKRIFLYHKGFRIYLGTKENEPASPAAAAEKPAKKKAAKKPASAETEE